MSKLTWHFQLGTSGQVAAIARASRAEYVKVLDPPSTDPFPGKRTIGRTFMDDNDSNRLVAAGADGARAWFHKWLPFYLARPYVWAWEGPNEPPVASLDQRLQLAAFTTELARLMHARSPRLRFVGLQLSVGCPDVEQIADLALAISECDAWATHEYSAPNLNAGLTWYCLRYRRFQEVLDRHNVRKPLIISELGIDGRAPKPPLPGLGWKEFCDAPEYMRQLATYDTMISQDNLVLCAAIFTSTPAPNWRTFDVDSDLSRLLAQHIEQTLQPSGSLPPPPPPPMDTRPILPDLQWPVHDSGRTTQRFGDRAIDYSRYGLYAHNGVDIAAPEGTPVHASHDGQAWTYTDPGYGNTVELWYPTIGPNAVYKTIYAHLSRTIAAHKQQVARGTVIGLVGNTGNSTGPHLHWGYKPLAGRNPGYRDWIDPQPHLDD